MRKPIALTSVAVLAALALAGCSAESEPEEPVDEPAVEESQPEETPAEEEDAAPAGEQAEVALGETIDDPDLGDSIEIVSAIRDFPSEEEQELIADGGEVVLLQLSVVPGEEYGGTVSAGDFSISWDEGADYWGNKTRMVEEEMTDAGFEPTDGFPRRDGEGTGWIAFLADERSDSYLVQYERGPASVIGSDEEIPAFTTEFEIPAP
ncbi:MAG: transcriptional regulator [Microbacterium sp.]